MAGVVAVIAALVAARGGQRAKATPSPEVPQKTEARETTSSAAKGSTDLNLTAVSGRDRQEQIRRVVEAMDTTGQPPNGVAQGGRRGGERGVFTNVEGRLPRKARGYWIESDVWPKAGPRGAERLIFGREREVYYTADHYETFVKLR